MSSLSLLRVGLTIWLAAMLLLLLASIPPREGTMPQLYELVVHATGEVRDADGNLIESQPVTSTVTVTEDQARTILAGLNPTIDPEGN